MQSSDVTEEELDSVLSALELELSIQKANISLKSCESYLTNHSTEPSFVYDARPPKNNLPFSVAEDNAEEVHAIETEIGELNRLVEKLQDEITIKQDNFKQEMESLSSKFTNAICIPPMERKCYNI